MTLSDNELYIQSVNTEREDIWYLKEEPISQKIYLLDYWKQNATRFLILNILTRKYLAIPATSASIERIFSISNDIITKKRNRLTSVTIKQLILLKS